MSDDCPTFDIYRDDIYLGYVMEIGTNRAPFMAISAFLDIRLGEYFSLAAAVDALTYAADNFEFVDSDD